MALPNTYADQIIGNALSCGYGVDDVAVKITSLGGTQAVREARVRAFIAEMRAAGTLTPDFFAPVKAASARGRA